MCYLRLPIFHINFQGLRKLFYGEMGKGGGWINILATMVCRRQNVLKLDRLKCPKIVTKKPNLNQKVNDSKSHIWILSFNSRFSSRKSQSQQKLAIKITHFTTQYCSKKVTHFTNLNSLNTITISRCTRTAFLNHLERECLYISGNLCK